MTTVDEDLREQVRDRYARAALTVTGGGRVRGLLWRATAAAARRWSDDEADAPFGAALYAAGETGGAAGGGGAGQSWAAATRWRSPSSGRVSGCSTWVPAAGSTCCCPPGGSARPGSPTAWT